MMAGNFFDNILYGSTWRTLRRQTTSSGNCRKHYQNLKANLICESGSVVFWWFGLKTKRHSMISFFFGGRGSGRDNIWCENSGWRYLTVVDEWIGREALDRMNNQPLKTEVGKS